MQYKTLKLFFTFTLFFSSFAWANTPAKPQLTFTLSSICSSILIKKIPYSFEKVEGKLGLFILKGAETVGYKHEYETSARYAEMIHEARGESLILVPSLGDLSVPAFDGVIVSAKGEFIANFTLKNLLLSEKKKTELNPRFEMQHDLSRSFRFLKIG